VSIAGPLWLGSLWDREFCKLMLREAYRKSMRNKSKVIKLIETILAEVEGPPTYYVIDRICDKFRLKTPQTRSVIEKLWEMGFFASQTHFNTRGVRTSAPTKTVLEVISSLIM